MATYEGEDDKDLEVYPTRINLGYGSNGEPGVHFEIKDRYTWASGPEIDLSMDQAELLLVQLMKAVCA